MVRLIGGKMNNLVHPPNYQPPKAFTRRGLFLFYTNLNTLTFPMYHDIMIKLWKTTIRTFHPPHQQRPFTWGISPEINAGHWFCRVTPPLVRWRCSCTNTLFSHWWSVPSWSVHSSMDAGPVSRCRGETLSRLYGTSALQRCGAFFI